MNTKYVVSVQVQNKYKYWFGVFLTTYIFHEIGKSKINMYHEIKYHDNKHFIILLSVSTRSKIKAIYLQINPYVVMVVHMCECVGYH